MNGWLWYSVYRRPTPDMGRLLPVQPAPAKGN